MTWFNIFNLTEWLETGLVSRTLTVFLEGRGLTEIMICQGATTNILIDDIFLPVGFQLKNPWASNGRGVFVDTDDNVWLGFEGEE